MRILSIHASSMWYHATQKTKLAERIIVREDRMEECVVLFCCVEKLDEKNPDKVIASAKQNILLRLDNLKVRKVVIYPYAHLTTALGSPQVALFILKGLGEVLSRDQVEVKRAPFGWYKEFEIRGKGHPLADLSMTICPYEGTECNFTCPPVLPSSVQRNGCGTCLPAAAECTESSVSNQANNRRKKMTEIPPTPKKALIVLGCPEAPAQQALAFHVAHNLRKRGTDVLIAGNPSVLNLLKVSDPEKHYITDTMVLEKCIAEVVEKKRDCDLCVVFAHNDAAIAYAATMRHLLPERRLVVIVFGKNPEPLAEEINFPCEKIVDKAVHNPMQLRAKINEVFGWAVSRT